jgi:hypothetical protein
LKIASSVLPGVDIPSADTILRVQKELATEKEKFISNQGIEHEFNINMSMKQGHVEDAHSVGDAEKGS